MRIQRTINPRDHDTTITPRPIFQLAPANPLRGSLKNERSKAQYRADTKQKPRMATTRRSAETHTAQPRSRTDAADEEEGFGRITRGDRYDVLQKIRSDKGNGEIMATMM